MIATTALAAQYAGTLNLSDTTKLAARATQPAPLAPPPNPPGKIVLAADLSTIANARLRLSDRRWDYTLSYSPSLSATDLELSFIPLTFQAGSAAVGWHDRFLRVLVSETASYGQLSSALPYQPPTALAQSTTPGQATAPGATTAPAQPTAPGQATLLQSAAPTTLYVGASDTSASMALRSTRRVTISLSGGYGVSGGLTTTTKAVIPEQYGPRVGAAVAYVLSRSDGLATLASAQETITSGPCPPPSFTPFCVERTPLVQVQESLRHQLSATMTLTIGVGAAASVVRTLTLEELVIQPIAVVALSDRFGTLGASTFTLSAQLGTVVDIRTGLPSYNVQTTAALADWVAPTIMLGLTAGLVQTVPYPPNSNPNPLTALSGGAEARFRLDRQLDVGLGVQEFWQRQTGYDPLASTIGYVSVTGRARTLHF
jgi:hypothetical protein